MKGAKPTAEPIRRCGIYTRKSTTAGLDQAFRSLDAQREACLAYIQRQKGWKAWPKTYEDGGFTGATLDRPAFQDLLQDVDAGLIDVVVVYKVDRLSRSLLDFTEVIERFHKKGVAFVSVTQNFSTADAMGRLTLNMLMSFAEFEREMIAERTRDKIAAARRKGKWTGGRVPLGYDLTDRRLVPNEQEAGLVRTIFSRYLEGKSAVAVAQWLNDENVPLKNLLKPRTNLWTKDLVLRILRCPTYVGMVHSHGRHYLGEHQPLVDQPTFHLAQARLHRKVEKPPSGGPDPSFLVRGTLRCGACGSVMTSSTHTRNGKVYRYYRCITRGKQGTRTCSTRQVPAEAIERFVVDQLQRALREGCFPLGRIHDQVQNLRTLISEMDSEREGNSIGEGSDTDAYFRFIDLDRKAARMREGLEGLQWLAGVLEHFSNLFEVLTPLNQQRLIRTLVERVVVDESKGLIQVQLMDLLGAA